MAVQWTDPLLDKAAVAEVLGITERTLERYVSTRKFPAPLRIGQRGCRRWRRSTVERFLEKLEKQAEAESAR